MASSHNQPAATRRPLPEPAALFGRLQYETGSEAGGRASFQALITDLVAVRHPTANEVSAPGGGDWGIDTYVGSLDESIAVWQSKFFLSWTGKTQQGQVRESFNQLREKAEAEGFKIDAWTLCVPCVLDPAEQKWFDGWKKRQYADHGIKIELWNGVELRRQLMQPDAREVRDAYFSQIGPRMAEPVRIGDVSGLDNALFVRQLEEAGRIETDAARGLFFAAEALARDFAAAGNRTGITALNELHLEIQALWEDKFNARVTTADADGRISGLIDEVLHEAAGLPDPEEIRLRPSHRKGVTHRLVEDARAGWVRHWREIATMHQGPHAREIIAAQLADATVVIQ